MGEDQARDSTPNDTNHPVESTSIRPTFNPTFNMTHLTNSSFYVKLGKTNFYIGYRQQGNFRMGNRQDEKLGQAHAGISRRDLLRSGVAGAVGLAAGTGALAESKLGNDESTVSGAGGVHNPGSPEPRAMWIRRESIRPPS